MTGFRLSARRLFSRIRRSCGQSKLAPEAKHDWLSIVRPTIVFSNTQVVLDRPLVYRAVKDRPIVISALHYQADYLLTLDRDDFHDLLGAESMA